MRSSRTETKRAETGMPETDGTKAENLGSRGGGIGDGGSLSLQAAGLEADPDLVDLFESVFARYAENRQTASAGATVPHSAAPEAGLDVALWAQLEELGLTRLTAAEEAGGSGAGWAEAAELLSAAARHGVRVPLAENDLLAEWLREVAGLTAADAHPDGASGTVDSSTTGAGASGNAVRTVAVLDGSGRAAHVPWASAADSILLVWEDRGRHLVAEVAAASVVITPGRNAAGEPRDAIAADLSALVGTEISADVVEQLRLRSALVRAVQVCAALDTALDLSVGHAGARTQFGRPLAKFQGVQAHLADMAAECALARAATESALLEAVATEWSSENLGFLVAAARSCVGHAASAVVRSAHQVHGAIGTTLEHPLHLSTRAALTWRSEYGSLASWDRQVTEAALAAEPGGLWELVTG
ncbi:acyl-CoA dehydrogenase [Brevibacterium sp.]|uniref:acyl-CoA dehydrogenase n=1 Tax=Brevibacterium sp. TaxID=1701 RepID=UPI0025B866B5|nr:acyl-CoA dehydrogenase [Brevibacterium sp.]